MKDYIIAVDQGTSSSKALVIDRNAMVVAESKKFVYETVFSKPGYVEFNPENILSSIKLSVQDVLTQSSLTPQQIAGMALSNQGETIIGFDRDTLDPIYPAISWQDRRNINPIIEPGELQRIISTTGLRYDPYFSAPKMQWLIQNVPGVDKLLEANRLCVATSDAWLLTRLLDEPVLKTDLATASRTLLLSLKEKKWDVSLCRMFGIDLEVLPDLLPNDAVVGLTNNALLGFEVPLCGICVDQQAALFGHFCFSPGDIKATYGTGCFILANIGEISDLRAEGLLTSIAWQVENKCSYAFDGGIYSAGSLYSWMIETLKIADSVNQIEKTIQGLDDAGGVFFIPALAGLAAPFWKPDMRGSWFGLSLSTDTSKLIRAVVESIAFRVKDVFDKMQNIGLDINTLRCDGGVTRSKFLMQFQADLLNIPLEVSAQSEATAYGAALLGGIGLGFWSISDLEEIKRKRKYITFYPDHNRHHKLINDYWAWKAILLKNIEE